LILEHAVLQVRAGQERFFEDALREAVPLIAASDGFRGIEVLPCIEQPGQYLLLVKWDSVAAHEQGFRGSKRYQKWKALLHHFYDPFPVVQHYGARVIS
jgi:heme-degrading monooxygenase HmoA